MNFTKQDIQRIASAISKLSKRDSDFPVTDRLSKDTLVPVLHNDGNNTVKMDKLLSYISTGVDVNKIPLSSDQFDGVTTLIGALYWLKARRSDGDVLDTDDVLVTDGKLNYSVYNFSNLTDFLYHVVLHLSMFTGLDSDFVFAIANANDINSVFTN